MLVSLFKNTSILTIICLLSLLYVWSLRNSFISYGRDLSLNLDTENGGTKDPVFRSVSMPWLLVSWIPWSHRELRIWTGLRTLTCAQCLQHCMRKLSGVLGRDVCIGMFGAASHEYRMVLSLAKLVIWIERWWQIIFLGVFRSGVDLKLRWAL